MADLISGRFTPSSAEAPADTHTHFSADIVRRSLAKAQTLAKEEVTLLNKACQAGACFNPFG
ncbi:MAG: hypothetical protein H6560_12050 [Lewinellaceae bacterium]|nr:hypothetical protein [Lewinellaceae bacterium]